MLFEQLFITLYRDFKGRLSLKEPQKVVGPRSWKKKKKNLMGMEKRPGTLLKDRYWQICVSL